MDTSETQTNVMMKSLYFLLLSVIMSQLISCACIENINRTNLDKIDKLNYSKLNGRYFNPPKITEGHIYKDEVSTTLSPQPFWSIINGIHWVYKENRENKSIKLEFKSQKKAVVSLYEGDTLISKKVIRGYFRDGYFYRNPYFVASPLIPLLFGYNTYRYRIGLIENSLIIDLKWNVWVYAVASGDYSKGQTSSTFERKYISN